MRLRASIAIVLCALLLAACGRNHVSVELPGINEGRQVVFPTEDPSSVGWHELARQARNMDAALASRYYTAVTVHGQEPLQLDLKGFSSAANLTLPTLPAPSTLSAAVPAHQASAVDPASLVINGADVEAALPGKSTQPGTVQNPFLSFITDTDPADPDVAQASYATYRFTGLQDYPTTPGAPQSLGMLWAEDDIPSYYFLALSDWTTNRWRWFECDADCVVTLPSLAPYIRPADGNMLAVVLVLDQEPRDLLFLQVGAQEVRAFGAAQETTPAGLDITEPDLYYPGKVTSAVDGAPSSIELDPAKLGNVVNQGRIGSCTGCSTSIAVNYELSRIYSPYWWPTLRRHHTISPAWLYLETPGGCGTQGRSLSEVMNFVLNTGVVTLADAPYNGGCAKTYDQPTCLSRAAYLKADYIRTFNGDAEKGVDTVKTVLGLYKQPVVFRTFLSKNLDAAAKSGTPWVYDPTTADLTLGHAMVFIGYDDSKQAFLVRNSWGYDWGDKGCFWLAYSNFGASCNIVCWYLGLKYNIDSATYLDAIEGAGAEAPQTFTASRNDPGKIHLSWSQVPLATGYKVFKDSPTNLWTQGTDVFTAIDDIEVTDNEQHTYWVQTEFNGRLSPTMATASGWRPIPTAPEIIQLYVGMERGQGNVLELDAQIGNPDDSTLSFSWDFDPGMVFESSPIPQRRIGVTLATLGTFNYTLTVTNAAGSDTKTQSLTVIDNTSLPIADVTGPAKARNSEYVTFDASASSAPAGHTLKLYHWDFNGDTLADESTTDPQVVHQFPVEGTYDIGVRVFDERDLASGWVIHHIDVRYLDETEPNELWAEADLLDLSGVKYWGSIGSRFGYPGYDGGQSDLWTIPAQPGDIKVTLLSYDQVFVPDAEFQLSLYKADGTYISGSAMNASNGKAEFVATPTGQDFMVYVKIFGIPGDLGGEYSLQFENMP